MREGVHKSIGVTHLPCNWLQCMENSLDPVHFEWLHANLMNFLAKKKGEPPVMKPTRHVKIAFEVFEYGIYKRRLLEGDDPETSPDWLVGHPVLFPNILAFKSKSGGNFQIRVPIDDTHTWHLMYNTRLPQNGEELTLSVYDCRGSTRTGRLYLDTVIGTDMMAWITQGPLTPRNLEHLGVSDRGVILYRNMLSDAINAVERGEDPPCLVRDPAKNYPMLTYRGEEDIGGPALPSSSLPQSVAARTHRREWAWRGTGACGRCAEPLVRKIRRGVPSLLPDEAYSNRNYAWSRAMGKGARCCAPSADAVAGNTVRLQETPCRMRPPGTPYCRILLCIAAHFRGILLKREAQEGGEAMSARTGRGIHYGSAGTCRRGLHLWGAGEGRDDPSRLPQRHT